MEHVTGKEKYECDMLNYVVWELGCLLVKCVVVFLVVFIGVLYIYSFGISILFLF